MVELALELEVVKGKKGKLYRDFMGSPLLQAVKLATIDLRLGYIHNGNLYVAQHITSLNADSNGLTDLVILQDPNKII